MKILLNSYPRTGTTYLINMLRWTAMHHLDQNRDGEYSNQPEWIIKSHEPILLLSSIPGVSQVTILRDPIDTIASNMFRHTSGLNSNSIWGHTGVSNENKTQNYNDPRFLDGLNQSVAKWKEYADNTIKNRENLEIISFDDMVLDTANTIISIFKKQNASEEIINKVTSEAIFEYTKAMSRGLENNPNHTSGADNRLPVAKPKEYYDVKSFVIDSKYASELLDLYENLKEILF